MSDVTEQYKEALRNRREGIMSELGPDATFLEVKPDYYADARLLGEDALVAFNQLQETSPPYGLVEMNGEPFHFQGDRSPWLQLHYALKYSGYVAVDRATPSVTDCPYHEVIGKKLGKTALPITPIDHNKLGLDTLRAVVSPGAELNAPLFVSLLRRMPALQALHGSNADREDFARRSVGLLREPLAHPQQWAAPFVYTLGTLTELLSSNFLCDEIAGKYTKVERDPSGEERLVWAIPTEDFVLRQGVYVRNRVFGSEQGQPDEHTVEYPVGTRLGDIKIDEPTIGCPGNQLAQAMWQRVIDVIVAEELWDKAK